MDSYLENLSLVFIKKFDHFLPMLLNNRARLLKITKASINWFRINLIRISI